MKAQAEQLDIDESIFEDIDIHVHVPAGAIPKDGPSAGIAMFVSLASLLKRESVRADIAMTGEISLRGLVLPVGGIKEKTIAAARAGIKRVILPARNRRDLEDIPQSTREALQFLWVEQASEALEAALASSASADAAADRELARRRARAARPLPRGEPSSQQPGASFGPVL